MTQNEIIMQLAGQGYEFLVVPITRVEERLLKHARKITRQFITPHNLAAIGSGATNACETLHWLVGQDYRSSGMVREVRCIQSYEDEQTQTEIWDALKSLINMTWRQQRQIVFILDLQGSTAFAQHVAKALGHNPIIKLEEGVAVQIDKTGVRVIHH